jgi:DNA-binding transcriptional LysR family regulator
MMLLNSESLRCFEAVASTLNFRLAAKRVALSPAAFSDRIQRLEAELDAALLERTTRKVALTAAGERLLPHVQRLLAAHDQCFDLVRGREAPGSFEVRLGTRYEVGLSWLVPSLPSLERLLPDFRVHLRFGDGPGLVRDLNQGLVDAILTSSRIVSGNLDARTLHIEHYVLVGAQGLLEKTPFRGVEDAPRHVLLDLSDDLPLSRYFLDQEGGSAAWAFTRVEHLGTIGAVRLRLLQGRGIAVLPRYFVAGDLKAGTLRRLLPRTTMQTDTFRLVWRQGHPRSEAFQRLAGHLKQLPLK